MANLECNAVSAVQVTHLLLGRMRAKKLRGCFVYTSSGGQRLRHHLHFSFSKTTGGASASPWQSPPTWIAALPCAGLTCSRCRPFYPPFPPTCSRCHDPKPLQRAVRLHQVVPLM